MIHRRRDDELEADVRHGELRAHRRSDDAAILEAGAPAMSWRVRDLEPFYQSYLWSAMLDPYELSEYVALTRLSAGQLFGRPVWRFQVRALQGYDPVCSSCPLVFSEVSQRLECGDAGVAEAGVEMPDGYDFALDVETGVIVSSRPVGTDRVNWFQNEILSSS